MFNISLYNQGPYYTPFIMNFENGLGVQPTTDDTGNHPLTYFTTDPAYPKPEIIADSVSGDGGLGMPSGTYVSGNASWFDTDPSPSLDLSLVGDFCLEGWVKCPKIASWPFGVFNVDLRGSVGANQLGFRLYTLNTSGTLQMGFEVGIGGQGISSSGTGSPNFYVFDKWMHFAMNRVGRRYRVWIDEHLRGDWTATKDVDTPDDNFFLRTGSLSSMENRLDSIRMVTGTGIYDGLEITPETPPYSSYFD